MTKALAELNEVALQEVTDRLGCLEDLLLDLEQDPNQREPLDEFMRAAHTLKGTAGLAGLGVCSELCHSIETVVERLRDGAMHATPQVFDRIAEGLEVISDAVAQAAGGQPEPLAVTAAVQRLERWLEQHGVSSPLEPGDAQHRDGFQLGEYDLLRIRVLKNKGHRLASVQLAVPQAEAEIATWGHRALRILAKRGSVLASLPPAVQFESLREHRRLLVLLATRLETEGVSEMARSEGLHVTLIGPYDETPGASAAQEPHPAPRQRVAADTTVRVELSVLDELLRLVGELMIRRDRYRQLALALSGALGDAALGGEVTDTAVQLGRLSSDLQDAIMSARMVPVGRLVRAMKREVRRVAREADASVSLTSRGEATELDKKLVDALSAALRRFANSAARSQLHGRNGSGGQLELAVERRWNQVVLTISCGTAVQERSALAELASSVSHCGGRLDTVARGAQRTSYQIALPLTLAIIQAIVARVGDEVYAVPIEAVRESLQLGQQDITSINGAPVVELRGRPLSLLFLNDYFRVPTATAESNRRVLVVGTSNVPVGVVVEEILGIREIVIKPMSAQLRSVGALSASAVLGDESIALVLNVEALVADAVQTCAALSYAPAAPAVHAIGAPA